MRVMKMSILTPLLKCIPPLVLIVFSAVANSETVVSLDQRYLRSSMEEVYAEATAVVEGTAVATVDGYRREVAPRSPLPGVDRSEFEKAEADFIAKLPKVLSGPETATLRAENYVERGVEFDLATVFVRHEVVVSAVIKGDLSPGTKNLGGTTR